MYKKTNFIMEGMIGEVRIFAGNFAPRSWAFCEGQLLAISQNTALFSILGTTYGGDGRTTFGLPDLRGRACIGPGTGPGLPTYRQGERTGTATTTLTTMNMPAHNHTATVAVSGGVTLEAGSGKGTTTAAGGYLSSNLEYKPNGGGGDIGGVNTSGLSATASVNMNGGGQAFNNMQPSLAMYYIICLVGIFPSRN